MEKFTVNSKKTGKQHPVKFNFGNSLEEAITKFGSDVVHNYFVDSAKTKLTNMVRNALESTVQRTSDDIDNMIDSWFPGKVMRGKKDPMDEIRKNATNLSPEQKLALARELGLVD
jgi:hypothetical protein